LIFVDNQLSFIFARISDLMASRLSQLRTNGRAYGPGRPSIFDAFSIACGSQESPDASNWARRALAPQTGPRVQITETDRLERGKTFGTYGTYYAGGADLLVIDDDLAVVAEYDLSRGYTPAADFLEAVLLHEAVHWARRWGGLDPGNIIRSGGAIEAGHYFETLAYGGPMKYLTTWPTDSLGRLNDARRFLSVNNVLMNSGVPVYKRPGPKLIW
jgi:zincin-like metallopeptidase toxin 3 of polymorphic toxin system